MNKAKLKDLPSLETVRLLLRPLRMSDAEDIFEYASDPEVTTYTFWYTHNSLDDSKKFISWLTSDHFACWGIVHKESNKVIGTCFFHSFNFQHRRADIAFNLSRKYWGQSYATETAREVILFGFNQWGLNRIQGTCMIKNIASARVMEKVGMTFEGILRKYTYGKGRFHDLKLYSILRDEI